MRGRKPSGLSLAAHDVSLLERIARSRILPWFEVQRARVVLGGLGHRRWRARLDGGLSNAVRPIHDLAPVSAL